MPFNHRAPHVRRGVRLFQGNLAYLVGACCCTRPQRGYDFLELVTPLTEKSENKTFEPSRVWRFAVLGMVGSSVFALDQISKAVVRTLAQDGSWSMPLLPGFMRFEFVANYGASFGMGEGHGFAFALFAIVATAAIVLYAAYARSLSKVEVLGLGLVMGGALGNMLDRLMFGYVTDFLCTEFISFPVFNIADIGICTGIALAFLGFMFLSPAAKVDATAELNRRDEARAARHAAARGRRAAKILERQRGQEAASPAGNEASSRVHRKGEDK